MALLKSVLVIKHGIRLSVLPLLFALAMFSQQFMLAGCGGGASDSTDVDGVDVGTVDEDSVDDADDGNVETEDSEDEAIIDEVVVDTDVDGVADAIDNCTNDSNFDQTDTDADGSGDICDEDDDGDGVADAADCNSVVATTYAGAPEYCNGTDDDCDGDIDEEAVDVKTWYEDHDDDGYGRVASEFDPVIVACNEPSGIFSYADNESDCNDEANLVSPGTGELCDGIDNDCDGSVDEDATDATAYYFDSDQDGYGNDDSVILMCHTPGDSDYIMVGGDCDGNDETIHPGAAELCNVVDDDCDGEIDESAADRGAYYIDADGDGFGDVTTAAVFYCADAVPAGYALSTGDCNESDIEINPAADEACLDSVDNDCDLATSDDCTEYQSKKLALAYDSVVYGDVTNLTIGYDVVFAGDINNGGASDIVVGAATYSVSDLSQGRAYVFYGEDSHVRAEIYTAEASAVFDTNTSNDISGSISDQFGYSIAAPGDVNGDGISDLLISVPGEDLNTLSDNGSVNVLFGSESDFTTAQIAGAHQSAVTLMSLSEAGDVNGDGSNDFLATSPCRADSNPATDFGKTFLVYGPIASSFVGTTDLTFDILDTDLSMAQFNFGESDYLCSAENGAAGKGDVNSDGFTDFAIGLPNHDLASSSTDDNAGAVFIVAGKSVAASPWSGENDISSATVTIHGQQSLSSFGAALVVNGDINADGFDDIVVGAPGYSVNDDNDTREGRVYIFYGRSEIDPTSTIEVSASDADVVITGESEGDQAGSKVLMADYDGDGYSDIIVAATLDDDGDVDAGAVYVIYGSASLSSTIDLALADIKFTGAATGDGAGGFLTTGDLNSDGKDDLFISAPGQDTGAADGGAVYIKMGEER
jgi:hypothetical protein